MTYNYKSVHILFWYIDRMLLALIIVLSCLSMGTGANYLDSYGSSIKTDLSDLQSVFHRLEGTPWSPAIVLTLDVSASMEYKVCITT
jgi:hypothetical protein